MGATEFHPWDLIIPLPYHFDEDSVFPISSTCALSLVLPSGYNEYEVFKEKAHYGCKNHGGFGKL